MSWGLTKIAVGVGVSVLGSSMAANASAKQAGAISLAENRAIAKHNMNQIVRNSYRTGMANLQLGMQKKQAAMQGFSITAQGQQVLSAATANQAASGTTGASADAVVNDIKMKVGEAKNYQDEQYEMMLTNYNNELEANRMNALSAVVDAKHYEYQGPSVGQMWGGALLQGAVNFAGDYAKRRIDLGLGPKVAPNTTLQGFNTNPWGGSTPQVGGGQYGVFG